MKAIEIIAQDLFEKVRSRFSNLQMGDENGAVTVTPEDARFFDFDFTVEGHELGRVSISINDTGNLKVFYSQGITEDSDSISQEFWYDFLREMRFFAKRRLLRFDTRDITKGNLDKTDFQYLAQNKPKDNTMSESIKEGMPSSVIKSKQEFSYMTPEELYDKFNKRADALGKPIEQIARETAWRHGYGKMSPKYWDQIKHLAASDSISESIMYGSSKTSHRTIEDTDLIIRHSEAIDPSKPGARSRKIKNLFVQNKEGERFKFPFIHLPGARAMQRHVANGGVPHDEKGKKIIQTCEEIIKLSDFGRKVKHTSLNDDAYAIAEKATNKLKKLRHHMECLSRQKYYEAWAETQDDTAPNLIELDDVTFEDYKSKFTVSKFDEALADVFPILHAIMQEEGELDLESYVSESLDEGLDDEQLKRLQQIVKEPMLVGSNSEAEQALLGIGINDPELIKAIRAVAAMPNGADADAREIIKTYLGPDATKIEWNDGAPAASTPPAPEPAAPEPAPEAAPGDEQRPSEDSIEHDDEHKLIEPENPKSKMKEIAGLVMGFYDRENGTWTKGEHGVVTHVKRNFSDKDGNGGEAEANLAAKLIKHLNQQHEEKMAFEDIRRLAGLR